MNQTNRFWKFVLFAFLTTLLVICGILYFFWQELEPVQSQVVISIILNHSEYFFCILFICFCVIFAILEITYSTYIKPLKKISSEAAVIYASNPSHRVEISGNQDIRNLSAVINNFADMFENLNKEITEQILSARKETEKERNLLAAIMAELPQGVFICNKNGRILLFNNLAKKMFLPESRSTTTEYFIGLGRSVYHLIDKQRIAHALEEIQERLKRNADSAASYFITPIQTGRIISIEAIPVLDQDRSMTGFILALKDISDEIHRYDTVHENLEAFRREIETRTSGSMLHSYDRLSDKALDALLTKAPLTRIYLPEFLAALKQTAENRHNLDLEITNRSDEDRVQADAYSFSSALTFLLKNLADLSGQKAFGLTTEKKGSRVVFQITWQNRPIIKKVIQSVLSSRMNGLPSFSYVLKQNNATFDIVCEKPDECARLDIAASAESKTLRPGKRTAPVITGSRPEFYDFNLFKKEKESADLLETGLNDLTYTIFDTETTGLNPDQGDEIISIAAVRIVNNRIVYQDIFEELVDPKRDIPIDSYKIHGISYEMVKGKCDINEVLPAFRQFTSNTVLVGHNIAFDMKMFKVKEKSTNTKFPNPVLDTLLLSAVIHPVHERHDLENIARRMGVNIVGRHTALGDTIATAQIFLKLLPVLTSNGILTLDDAIRSSQKTYYARLKY